MITLLTCSTRDMLKSLQPLMVGVKDIMNDI